MVGQRGEQVEQHWETADVVGQVGPTSVVGRGSGEPTLKRVIASGLQDPSAGSADSGAKRCTVAGSSAASRGFISTAANRRAGGQQLQAERSEAWSDFEHHLVRSQLGGPDDPVDGVRIVHEVPGRAGSRGTYPQPLGQLTDRIRPNKSLKSGGPADDGGRCRLATRHGYLRVERVGTAGRPQPAYSVQRGLPGVAIAAAGARCAIARSPRHRASTLESGYSTRACRVTGYPLQAG